MNNKLVNRRDVLKGLVSFAGFAAMSTTLVGRTAQAQGGERRRGGGSAAPAPGAAAGSADDLKKPFVVPGKDTAVPVNYVEDKKKITDAKLKEDRQGVKFADQHCSGCGFYKSVGKKDGKEAGTCTIFPSNLVKGDAWCSTWNKKS